MNSNCRVKIIKLFILISGTVIFIYFAIAAFYRGKTDLFYLSISLSGLLIIFISFKFDLVKEILNKLPKAIKYVINIILICFILSFLIIQMLIINNKHGSLNNNGAEYLIVLGCYLIGENPSQLLTQRALTAISILNNKPEINVIVTGGTSNEVSPGQEPGEKITEAQVLKKLLLDNNIDKSRIFTENKSKNTLENLKFSDELFNLKEKNIIIVTSDYHAFRALTIAKKLNYTNVSVLSSRSSFCVLPALHIREYVSIIHNLLHGRL